MTVIDSVTHVRDNYEHSKWRTNRAKYWERYRGKPCFLHFTSLERFRSRSTTHFWEEITGVHVLTIYLYKFSLIKAEKSIAKCRQKSISWLVESLEKSNYSDNWSERANESYSL